MILKTCIQVLMTREQYSAIRFVGRNLPKKNCADQVANYLNHIEQMDLIDKNDEYCVRMMEKFLID